MNKVLMIDTSILCVWLKVPNMDTCGSDANRWDFDHVNSKIETEIQQGTRMILPLATIIETGNHIAQANGDRYKAAQRLSGLMIKVADKESPWESFNEQIEHNWSNDKLKELALEWPKLAAQKLSIGDATIKNVAAHYARLPDLTVEIFTGDQGLKAYEALNLSTKSRRNL